jgi:hypothetical protein
LLQITRNEERQGRGLQWQNAPTAVREYLLSSSQFKTDWPRQQHDLVSRVSPFSRKKNRIEF